MQPDIQSELLKILNAYGFENPQALRKLMLAVEGLDVANYKKQSLQPEIEEILKVWRVEQPQQAG